MNSSPARKELNIVIDCEYAPHHEWMSFICWYSIYKNLPKANVRLISCKRSMTIILFDWARKCKIPLIFRRDLDIQDTVTNLNLKGPTIIIPPDSVCIRDFEEAKFSLNLLKNINFLDENLSCDCKEEKFSVFTTYSNGWGKFVTSPWVYKVGCPFGKKYNVGEMTVNEVRLGRLWDSAALLYKSISGA